MKVRRVQLRENRGIGFEEIRSMAKKEAAKFLKEPMLMSWINRFTGQHYPDVDCCQEEGKESWEIYAERRGGNVRIEVDDSYIFIFREGGLTN